MENSSGSTVSAVPSSQVFAMDRKYSPSVYSDHIVNPALPISKLPAHIRQESLAPPYQLYPTRHVQTPEKTHQRKCRFELLYALVVLFIVVVASIVTALLLTVFKHRSGTINTCKAVYPCDNDGVSSMSKSMQCNCVCQSPWIGPQCTVKASPQCSTIQSGDLSQAIGSQLPQHIDAAKRFGMTLNTQAILRAFNASHVPCEQQNQLVSIAGSSKCDILRKRNLVEFQMEGIDIKMVNVWEPGRVQSRPTTTKTVKTTTTKVNFLKWTPATTVKRATTSASFASTSTSTAVTKSEELVSTTSATSTPTSIPTTSSNSFSETAEFARISVLYTIATHGLSPAIALRTRLDAAIQNDQFPVITIPGLSVDLRTLRTF